MTFEISKIPRQVDCGPVSQIEVGINSALALNENGELCAIGINSHGELGLNNVGKQTRWVKVDACKEMKIIKIQCGWLQSAILAEEGLFVMGQGLHGGASNKVVIPTKIDLANIVDVSLR